MNSLLATCLAFALFPLSSVPAAPLTGNSGPVAVLVPIGAEASWRDDAYLAAIGAAGELNDGAPLALAVDVAAPWRPELLDFLGRLAPARVLWVGAEPAPIPIDSLPEIEHLAAGAGGEAASALARTVWSKARRAVLFDSGDRSAALAASALAARLGEPLFPCAKGTLEPTCAAAMEHLGVKSALYVGSGRLRKVDGVRVTTLDGAEAVARWMTRHRFVPEYLAAVNPSESVAGQRRHLALAAPLLAAARSGAVAPLPFETRWKSRFDAGEELGSAPSGAGASTAGWRRGALAVGERAAAFVTGRGADGRWWMQIDRNGDQRFDGNGEQPLHTGESFSLGGRRWTADLDAEEKRRGQAVWLVSPTADELCEALEPFHAAAAGNVQALCMVGWPDALPMAVIAHGQGIDADLVSDIPFAQTDPDPFVELGLARFVAEDLPSATLLACRGFARDVLADQSWRNEFTTAEWAGSDRTHFEAAGLRFAGHHSGEAPIDAASPLAGAGVILHSSHSMWTVLGATYTWNSDVLLAPAFVESLGCSTASLDQDGERRSVATRMLKNGAVAFVGNTRRGIAQSSLYRTELWNALFRGATLGEAQRDAQNRLLVAVLEKNETDGGRHYYQLYNQAAFGDPALQLGLALARNEKPVRIRRRGSKVTVEAPGRWHRVEFVPNADWKCDFTKLYSWTGAGAGVESTWFGPEKRNADLPYITVEARTTRPMTGVEPVGEVPQPLGWTGTAFVDEHVDGSRSLFWRVLMIDGDMTTGDVREEVDRLTFRLIAD